ncbi:extracellular solute-binding protein [Leifsonia sp. ZF2019]|uniref:extracellular solute-binding protein n=1 Tax=Leifsonia sp. ZF2019 TaxID=2781978 RepID=UPI001CC10684|nr:extracellular solute-binding protein [Leifsonia sp. ZF2019]UAJ79809.1 extracellular solute-binding protein [Leifsonia sp. ZF2019]
MKRSTALAGSAAMAAAIALVVAGCSSPSAGSSTDGSSSNPVTLTFWGSYGNGGNSTQEDALNKTLIPAFEKANPGIKVDYVDIPYDSLLQKLTTSAAGGTLPDLVRSDIGWVPQLGQLGVLTPLSDSMSDFGTLSKATYPGSLATNKYNGKYYGLPLDANTRVLITSQKALDAAGMSTPPATFDDLKQMAAKLKGTGVSVFADGGLGGWNIYPWIWSNGGSITNSGLTKATGYLNGDKSVAAIQMLVDLYKEGQIPNLITGNQGATSTSDGLPTGKYATILDGPWMKGIWAGQYKDFKPVYAPVPHGDGPSTSVVGGEDIVLTASSKHQAAAEKFIRFTQSESFQIEMAKTGQMTVIPAYASKQAAIDPYYTMYADQLKTAKARLAIPQGAKVDNILSTALTPAFTGSTSVKDALTTAAQQIDPLLTGK